MLFEIISAIDRIELETRLRFQGFPPHLLPFVLGIFDLKVAITSDPMTYVIGFSMVLVTAALALMLIQALLYQLVYIIWFVERRLFGLKTQGAHQTWEEFFTQPGKNPISLWNAFTRRAEAYDVPKDIAVYNASPDIEFIGNVAYLKVSVEGKRPFYVCCSTDDATKLKAFPVVAGPRTKEMAIPGSPSPIKAVEPSFQVQFWKNDVLIGSGFRVGNFIVTARHVLDEWATGPSGVLRSGNYKEVISFPLTKRLKVPEKVDLAAFQPGRDLFSTMHLTTAKFKVPVAGVATITATDALGNSTVSYGNLERDSRAPRSILHTMSTCPGFSGAPILQGGAVVGVHLGAMPEIHYNYGVSVRDLSTWLAAGLIQESAAPDTQLDRLEYEAEWAEVKALLYMKTNPRNKSEEFWTAYDDIEAGLYDALVYGEFDSLKDALPEMERRAERGDEDARKVVKLAATVHGTARPSSFTNKRKSIGPVFETVTGIKPVAPAKAGKVSTPLLTPSAVKPVITSSKTVSTKDKPIPEASDSKESAPVPRSVPSLTPELDRRLTKLEDLLEKMVLAKRERRLSTASDNSSSPPEAAKPSESPSSTKQGGSSAKKTAKEQSQSKSSKKL